MVQINITVSFPFNEQGLKSFLSAARCASESTSVGPTKVECECLEDSIFKLSSLKLFALLLVSFRPKLNSRSSLPVSQESSSWDIDRLSTVMSIVLFT